MRLVRLFLRYNLRSLLARGTDAVTTLGGIALTAAVLVVVLALAYGLDKAFASSGHEGVAILCYKGAPSETQSQVDAENVRLVGTLPGIERHGDRPLVSPELVVLMNLRRRGGQAKDEANVTIRGVTDTAFELRPEVKVIEGRRMAPDLGEVIVGKELARRFEGCGLGETFGFGRNRFKVVGIYESPGAGASEIWGHVRDVQAAFLRPGYSSMRLRLAAPAADSLPLLQTSIEQEGRLQVRAQLERSYYSAQQDTASKPVKVIGWVLAVCMSFGASLGAMNTMYARVATRGREIGTLRAVGFGRFTIVVSFVLESIALSVAGGAIGCLVAFPVNGVATGTTNFNTFSEVAFAFAVTPAAVGAALVLSGFVGLAGGLLPALQAARMPIPSALREI